MSDDICCKKDQTATIALYKIGLNNPIFLSELDIVFANFL